MNGRLIDYGVVIWLFMRDFIKSMSEKSYIPFLTLVTKLVEAVGIKGPSREKMVPPSLGPITSITKSKSKAASVNPPLAQPPPATSGASSSLALEPKNTPPLKRMERRIKGWFQCILGKQKQIDHRLFVLEREVHILRGEPVVVEGPPPNLEGDSDELDDYEPIGIKGLSREKNGSPSFGSHYKYNKSQKQRCFSEAYFSLASPSHFRSIFIIGS